MIVEIVQTKSNFDMLWEVREKNHPIGACASSFEQGRFCVNVNLSGFKPTKLYYNPADITWGSRLSDRLSFKIFREDEKVGTIVGRTKKTAFLKAYAYYDFVLDSKQYYGYEVGFGRDGLFLCVYHEEKLIAIVEKSLRVVNFKDKYTAYVENPADLNTVLLLSIYYDATAYGDVMEIAVASIKEKHVNTVQKELKDKFNSDFISKIKDMS